MDAEKQKADSGADHAEKTQIFHAAESRVSERISSDPTGALLDFSFKSHSRYNFSNKSLSQAFQSLDPTSMRSRIVRTSSTHKKSESNNFSRCFTERNLITRLRSKTWR